MFETTHKGYLFGVPVDLNLDNDYVHVNVPNIAIYLVFRVILNVYCFLFCPVMEYISPTTVYWFQFRVLTLDNPVSYITVRSFLYVDRTADVVYALCIVYVACFPLFLIAKWYCDTYLS